MIQLAAEIVKNQCDIAQYVADSTHFNTTVGVYRKYQRGEYSEKASLKALGAT